MALIVDIQKGITTVGELIQSLQRFPADMPIRLSFGEAVVVYRLKPRPGEVFDDDRGEIQIDEDDGSLD